MTKFQVLTNHRVQKATSMSGVIRPWASLVIGIWSLVIKWVLSLGPCLFLFIALLVPAVAPNRLLAAESFDPADVTLADSPFKAAADRNAEYLLSLEPDRFLHYFRTEAGLESRAPAYGGWESPDEGAGRCLGHYLSALAMQYRSTTDPRLKAKIDYLVDQLAEIQIANGDGYLGAESGGKKFWAALKAGDPNALKKHRVPWYIQHKMFAGLRDVWLMEGNVKSKSVLIGLGDWAIAETANLDDAGMQSMLDQEHGGMVEVLADLYEITQEQKYLTLSRRFVHTMVMDRLAAGRDQLDGLHANTQIPKVIGAARLFEVSGDVAELKTAEFFWETVVSHHSYANGGNSDHERFGPADRMGDSLGVDSSETCNTYNMLKLTDYLFRHDPQVKYADYIERGLFNHILASAGPAPGNFTYYVSMKPGHFRAFSKPYDSFWCCVGTGMENQAKYNQFIYSRDDDGIWVNQFIPSKVSWKSHGVTIEQKTDYPRSGEIHFLVTAGHPIKFAIRLRYPAWALSGATVAVNGTSMAGTGGPGTWVSIDRVWGTGDRVDFALPIGLRTEALLGDPDRVAVFDGPVLLAGLLSPITPDRQLLGDSPATHGPDDPVADLPVRGLDVGAWVRPVSGKPNQFETYGPAGAAVPLAPFFQAQDNHYTVYWRLTALKQNARVPVPTPAETRPANR